MAPASDESYNAILDQGSDFEGKLTFEGTVRIDGSFKGEIFSDATLIVGESGKLEADVHVRHIIISGEVIGNVEASERIEINAPGVLKGNIKTPTLVIDEGVVFEGSCNMTSVPKGGTVSLDKVRTLDKKEEGQAGAVAQAVD